MNDIESLKSLALQLEERVRTVQQSIDEETKVIKAEKERWEEEKKLMASKYDIKDNIIDLNVGGKHFTTYKSVLCSEPGSMLEAMFSGRHPLAKDSKGRYFLDCDSEAFDYVLANLRNKKVVWPDSPAMRDRVVLLYKYLNLDISMESSILTEQSLLDSFNKLFTARSFRLLYRASVDGWKSQTFHQKCDGIPNTVTLVQVGRSVFGGYTPLTWNAATDSYAFDPSSFLFSLRNPSNTHTDIKFLNSGPHGKHSIYSNNNYGPTFGGGHDFYIASDANQNKSSYTSLGYSYVHPSYSYNSNEAKNFFCGSYNFTATELEVFTIDK